MDASLLLDKAQTGLQTARTRHLETVAQSRQDPAKVREAAEEVEAFFLGLMLESMFAGIKTDVPFGGGHGEQVFRSLLLQEYGKSIAKTGTLGIADAVQREILRLQEVQNS